MQMDKKDDCLAQSQTLTTINSLQCFFSPIQNIILSQFKPFKL